MMGVNKRDVVMYALKSLGAAGFAAAMLLDKIWVEDSTNTKILQLSQMNPQNQTGFFEKAKNLPMDKFNQLQQLYQNGQLNFHIKKLGQNQGVQYGSLLFAFGFALKQTIQLYSQVQFDANIDGHSAYIIQQPTTSEQTFLKLKQQMLTQLLNKGGMIRGVIPPVGKSSTQSINFASLDIQNQSIFTVITPTSLNYNIDKDIGTPIQSWYLVPQPQLRFIEAINRNADGLYQQLWGVNNGFFKDLQIFKMNGQKDQLIKGILHLQKRIPILATPAKGFHQKFTQINTLFSLFKKILWQHGLNEQVTDSSVKFLFDQMLKGNIFLDTKGVIIRNVQSQQNSLSHELTRGQSIGQTRLQSVWKEVQAKFLEIYQKPKVQQNQRIMQVKNIFKSVFESKNRRYDDKIFDLDPRADIQLLFNVQYFNKVMRKLGVAGISSFAQSQGQLALIQALKQIQNMVQNQNLIVDANQILIELNKTFQQASAFSRLQSYFTSFFTQKKPPRYVQLGKAQLLLYSKQISQAWYKGADAYFQNEWIAAVMASMFTMSSLMNFTVLTTSIVWAVWSIRKIARGDKFRAEYIKKYNKKAQTYQSPDEGILKAIYTVTPTLLDSKILIKQINEVSGQGWKLDVQTRLSFSQFQDKFERFILGYTDFLSKPMYAVDNQNQKRKIILTKYHVNENQKPQLIDKNYNDVWGGNIKRQIERNLIQNPKKKKHGMQQEQSQEDEQTPLKAMRKMQQEHKVMQRRINQRKQMKFQRLRKQNYEMDPIIPQNPRKKFTIVRQHQTQIQPDFIMQNDYDTTGQRWQRTIPKPNPIPRAIIQSTRPQFEPRPIPRAIVELTKPQPRFIPKKQQKLDKQAKQRQMRQKIAAIQKMIMRDD